MEKKQETELWQREDIKKSDLGNKIDEWGSNATIFFSWSIDICVVGGKELCAHIIVCFCYLQGNLYHYVNEFSSS